MKRIILLSDGTGNSAAALFKTNVWRVYQALDLTPSATPAQIAFYDDGVGTSRFRPLALIGGAFGFGLARNVLSLYRFLCREWQVGDEIHLFGFSRGAFTVRVLLGLIEGQGLVEARNEQELKRAAVDAYRAYRGRFNQTGGLVGPLRALRNGVVYLSRCLRRLPVPNTTQRKSPPDATPIAFIGVWDTVAAYGLPLAELTRAIDEWVWPLSMPDYTLHERVACARHALALDDERDTFHPLLWDEVHERSLVSEMKVRPDRMLQVWFAGMHADVGGGYPDDALAHRPLLWMIDEAANVGLRFRPIMLQLLNAAAGVSARIHDSRAGMAGYYRYQPRRIASWLEQPDPTSLIVRPPDTGPLSRARLVTARLHASVFERMRVGPGSYVPIALPADYRVVGGPVPETPGQAQVRVQGQEAVRNDIWRRRVTYFSMVLLTAALVSCPLWEAQLFDALTCTGFLCIVSPAIRGIGAFLPSVASPLINAFARHPGILLTLGGGIVWLLGRSAMLQRRIHDRARALWQHVHGQPSAAPRTPLTDLLIGLVRRSPPYQHGMRFVKWHVLPHVFGIAMLLALVAAPFAVPVLLARQQLATMEADGTLCELTASRNVSPQFDTRAMCWDAHRGVTAGRNYRVSIRVIDTWKDKTVETDPQGFTASELGSLLYVLAAPTRRDLGARWFSTFLSVSTSGGELQRQRLDFIQAPDGWYSAIFQAHKSGDAQLWVNDAVIGPLGITASFYDNNQGRAEVTISELPE